MAGEPLIILLIEDNLDHAELIKRSFENHRIANQIYHIADGETAVKFLFKEEEIPGLPNNVLPNIILLDLRLPKIDGLEILKLIKKSEELRQIPVVILTTSEAEKDVAQAYDYHANSYLVKPLDFEKFVKMMEELGFYWLGWNIRPWN